MERLFRALLRLAPRDFREAYGPALLEALATKLDVAWHRGRARWAMCLVREAVGLVRVGMRERRVARLGGATRSAAACRAAWRLIRRHPMYATASAGTLAVAVATAAVSLAVVDRAFFAPLPYESGDELMALYTVAETWPDSPVSPHVLRDMEAAGAPFVDYAPMDPSGVALGTDEGSVQATALYVTPSYFSTLGVRPALGSVWADGERDGVVVSWSVWREALGGIANPVGRTLSINGAEHVVTGVMPEDHVPPWFTTTGVWMPLDLDAEVERLSRGARTLSLVGRRAPGVTPEQVDAFLELFSERLRVEHVDAHGRQHWVAEPLRTTLVGATRPALMGVAAGGLLLVLIVGANLAGLGTVREVVRGRQAAIRTALGARRADLIAERLAEGLAVSVVGVAVGLVLARWAVDALVGVQRSFLARLPEVTLGGSTIALAGLLGLTVGLLASIAPWIGRRSTAEIGAGTSRGVAGSRSARTLRSGLVVAQVSLALVLVVGAGLLVRSVRTLMNTDLGYDVEGVYTVGVNLSDERYVEPEAQIAYELRVLERLDGLPGVEAAAASVGVPVIGQSRASLAVADVTTPRPPAEIAYFSMAPGYMEMMGVRLLAGRFLTPDDDLDAPRVVLVNETLARRDFGSTDVVGRQVRIGEGSDDDALITIVGVVADLRQHGPTQAVLPTAFGSSRQFSSSWRMFSVRTGETAAPQVVASLRTALAEVDPGAPVADIVSMDELIAERTERYRLVLATLGGFGVLAAGLAAFGLFAVVSLTSRLRRREYAIRLAVGSSHRAVRRLVLRQALVLACIGVAVGSAAAALSTRVLEGMLHGVTPLDPLTFAAAALGVLTLSVLAAFEPARRSGRVDPIEALQAE